MGSLFGEDTSIPGGQRQFSMLSWIYAKIVATRMMDHMSKLSWDLFFNGMRFCTTRFVMISGEY